MKNIYFVGAPTQAKGIEDFNFLAKNLPAYNFYWFTFKIDNEIMRKYKHIKFIVGLNDSQLRDYISKKMDLFISCSYYEGFCLPIAEALLMEKPVISYQLEEIESEFGKNISYIECFNKEKFLTNLKIFKHPDQNKKSHSAKKFIEINYSPETVADKLLKALI